MRPGGAGNDTIDGGTNSPAGADTADYRVSSLMSSMRILAGARRRSSGTLFLRHGSQGELLRDQMGR